MSSADSAAGTPADAAADTAADTAAGAPPSPAIGIHGTATAEQVAALVAVLSAVGGDETPADDGRAALWSDHARAVGLTPGHGRGAWRASSQPR